MTATRKPGGRATTPAEPPARLPSLGDWTEDELLARAHEPNHRATGQLFDYWEGRLSFDDRRALEDHAGDCDYCGHRLGEVGDLVGAARLARLNELRGPLQDYL